jgi:hypothetical protein
MSESMILKPDFIIFLFAKNYPVTVSEVNQPSGSNNGPVQKFKGSNVPSPTLYI